MDEIALVKACQKQDATAQNKVFRLYYRILFVMALRYLPCREDAEDIVAESFIKIFASFEKFDYRGAGSLQAWMKKITINECLMQLRKKSPIWEDLSRQQPLPAAPAELEEGVISNLKLKDLLNLMEQMPPGYRSVVQMYIVDGYSHKEIAGILGISESTSKTQLMHGKKWLQQKIKIYESASI